MEWALLYVNEGRGREASERCFRNVVVTLNNRDVMLKACSNIVGIQ